MLERALGAGKWGAGVSMSSVVIERGEQKPAEAIKPGLFQVWIDLGDEGCSDWWWNSEPQPLAGALDECAECRAGGWVAVVTPEGENPRPDGRWDNP